VLNFESLYPRKNKNKKAKRQKKRHILLKCNNLARYFTKKFALLDKKP